MANNELNNRLYGACLEGNHHEVTKLLSQGADPCACDNDLLPRVCKRNYYKIAEVLLTHGADVHALDDEALMIVCKDCPEWRLLLLLLGHGADVHARNDEALMLACEKGYGNIVEELIDHGANVHARDNEALIRACNVGYSSIVTLLIDNGLNVNIRGDEAMLRCMNNSSPDALQILLDNGVSVPTDVNRVNKAFYKSVECYGHEMVYAFVSNGFITEEDVLIRALTYAVRIGSEKVIGVLLNCGVDANKLDDELLIKIVKQSEHELLNTLLSHRTHSNALNNSLLMHAIHYRDVKSVEILLKHGANSDEALRCALTLRRDSIVRVVLKALASNTDFCSSTIINMLTTMGRSE